jgi:hypothetical protein
MSYVEKRTIASIVSGTIFIVAYIISGIAVNHPIDDVKFWAIRMLAFLAIAIPIMIVTQIVFHILLSISIAVREHEHDDKKIEKTIKAEFVEDERDKLIELKSSRIGYFFAGTGFVLALISILLDYSAGTMLHVIFFSLGIGSTLEGLIQLYYYRKEA